MCKRIYENSSATILYRADSAEENNSQLGLPTNTPANTLNNHIGGQS